MSVFITGASSGIGEACAKAFAAEGKDLVLLARREQRLHALAEKLREDHGIHVHVIRLDVRDRAEVERLIEDHLPLLKTVEVLINNAGLAKGLDTVQEGSPEDWEVMIDTNIKGLLYVTRALLPSWVERGTGHIVNIGSVAGYWVYPKGNVYCATKHAVRALTEGMRMDLLGTGIRVTEISPGMVETEFSEVRLGDKEKAKKVYAGLKPLTAEDIAESVVWAVKRPAHVNIQEIVIYPTAQASPMLATRG